MAMVVPRPRALCQAGPVAGQGSTALRELTVDRVSPVVIPVVVAAVVPLVPLRVASVARVAPAQVTQ
jgi:hypothetical protein